MADMTVLYARKSDPGARDNDASFEQQEQACEAYAAKMGYTVIDRIREAYTGTDLVKQDGLWRAIDAVKHGRAQVVIAYSYDRLSRDTQAQEVALWEIERKYGGRFEAATEQIDRDDPLRQMIRASLGAASAMERRRVVERLTRGKRDRAERRGALSAVSCPKYGYRFADEMRTAYTPERETAATVRRIYGWADQGYGMRWIARRLNDEHVPTPGQWASEHGYPKYDKKTGVPLATGDVWSQVQVHRILADSAYCGRMQVFKMEVTHPYRKNKATGVMEKQTVVREREQGAVTLPESTCPAIISPEQWELVQNGVAGRVKEGRPPLSQEDALFRGHVYCACGRKMHLSRNVKGTYLYLCPRRPTNVTAESHACPYGNQNIRAYIVNAEGETALRNILERREDLARLLEARIAGTRDEALERVTANLQEMVTRKKTERENYLKGIGAAKDPSTIAVLVEQAEKLAQEIRDAEAQIAENRPRLDSLETQRNQFVYVLDRLDSYRVQYVDSTSTPPPSAEDKRFLMDLVGLKLTVYPVGVLPNGKRVKESYAVKGDTPLNGTSLTSSVTLSQPCCKGR